MTESTLISYAEKFTRDQLALVPTPQGTITRKPVPHIEVVQAIIETLGFRHIGVVKRRVRPSPATGCGYSGPWNSKPNTRVAGSPLGSGTLTISQCLAVELAPFGIRVNSISPGPIETEFHDVVMPQRAATLGITKQEMIEKVRKSIPPGSLGKTQ
jgi:Enoyl-(Acyl carrier protein) reductase